jgi:hypothetical protein
MQLIKNRKKYFPVLRASINQSIKSNGGHGLPVPVSRSFIHSNGFLEQTKVKLERVYVDDVRGLEHLNSLW